MGVEGPGPDPIPADVSIMWMSLDLEPKRAPRTPPASALARARPQLRALATLIALSFSVLVGLPATQAAAAAGLTPEAIAAYNAKLERARAARTDLNARVECLIGRDAALAAQRDEKQRLLGKLREDERKYSSAVDRYDSEYRSNRVEFERLSRELPQLHRKLDDLEDRKRKQETSLMICEMSMGPFPGACKAYADLLAKFIRDLRDVRGDINRQRDKIDTAMRDMRTAEENLEQNRRARDEAQTALDTNARMIRTHETDISAIQSVLSELRPSVQSQQILIDTLRDALVEAGKVDTEDGRARTARKVQAIADEIDDALDQSNQALAHARTVLPQEVTRSCVAA
jgi:chromosome segregation ATPase